MKQLPEQNQKIAKQIKMYQFLFVLMLVASVWIFTTIILGFKQFHVTKLISYLFMFLVFVSCSFYYRKKRNALQKQINLK